MNELSGRRGISVRRVMPVVLWLAGTLGQGSAAPTNSAPAEPFDYAQPQLLTGKVCEPGTQQKQILFTFRRTATRAGSTVRVERRFDRPDGSMDAVENIVYESGRLVSYEMKDLSAGLWGTILIYPDSKNPARNKIFINHGHDGDMKNKGSREELPDDTLIDDTLYPFVLGHWDDLLQGKAVKFHFVSLEMEKAFGFKLVKAPDETLNGKSLVRIKMEPTSLLVAQFIEPIYFTIEKDGSHRLLEYTGRTTPRIKKGKAWKYLDAETVFEWK